MKNRVFSGKHPEPYQGAKVKPGWKKPTSPKCTKCGADVRLVAVQDSDCWYLMWEEWCYICDTPTNLRGDEGLIGEDVWPFEDDYARSIDFELLDIWTEVA